MDAIARSRLDCNRNKEKKLKQRIKETELFTNMSNEKRLIE